MLPAFLHELFDHGRVRVAPPDVTESPSAGHSADADQAVYILLAERDAAVRIDFPGEAPPPDFVVAVWAARQFHRACQFALYRDLSSEAMAAAFAEPCPAAADASRHYSVDLVFRFLPDLYRLTRSASSEDPLCEQLRRWADAWPLSSVGMGNVNPADVGPILEHQGLLKLYVDRIIAREDSGRLTVAAVRAAVRAALGVFTELAPTPAAACLEPAPSPTV